MTKLMNAGVIALLGLAGAACTITPEPVEVETALPSAYQTASVVPVSETHQADWWMGFDDPELTALIELAQTDNLDIQQTLTQLRATYALTEAIRSDLFPTFDGFLDNRLGSLLTSGIDPSFTGSLGASMSFDPDITGRNKNRLAAARADYLAAELGVSNLRRLIREAVALQYIELRRAGARLALLQTTLDLQQTTLEIVEARYAAGLSPKLDVDRTRADLSRTRAQQSLIQSNRQQAIYALSVLTGQMPGALTFSEAVSDEIPVFSAGAAVSLPADLVRRRPDIRAAEASLQADIIQISVEKADLLPSLRLPGSISAGYGDVSGSADEISLSLSALLDIPLFDYGRREAEVEAQRARAEASAIAYRSSVLSALQEVEGSLVQIQAIQQSLDLQLESVRSSEAAYDQLDALYREGLASFIDVLDAQRTLISSRESIVQTEANLASAIVSLYAALDAGCAEVAEGECIAQAS